MFFSYVNIKARNVITIITSLGTRVLIGILSEISKVGLFRQFCVQEFSADLELHELALQRGKLVIAELSSGPKGRRAEPHNYRAKIEIEKTMRLSFHGHRG